MMMMMIFTSLVGTESVLSHLLIVSLIMRALFLQVEEVIIRPEIETAMIKLHPGAMLKGRRVSSEVLRTLTLVLLVSN